MALLGLDIGTTNCKAGLFQADGTPLLISSRPTVTKRTEQGYDSYDPDQLWDTVASTIRDVTSKYSTALITSIGISGMSEAGILLDRSNGRPKSHVIPWYDKRTMKQFALLKLEENPKELFTQTGLHPSYKYGLCKLLWLEDQERGITKNAIWLSVPDYIAYRLTGVFKTDYTLAARTYAFRIDRKEWNDPWIRHLGLSKDLFPEALPSGTPIGFTESDQFTRIGLKNGIPVAVSGHDHLCASMTIGAIQPGAVFNSMGTAETLIGTLEQRDLGEFEFQSGLSFGCHVIKNQQIWLGGLSSSGGSVEWLRKLLSENTMTYDDISESLAQTQQGPTGILYFPYLSGSGAPNPDPKVNGALLGLKLSHTRSDLLKACLEGTAYELESIRRAAVKVYGSELQLIVSVGGGTRNPHWMQIKSNVSNCEFHVPQMTEASLLGGALVAAIGSGFYSNAEEAFQALKKVEGVKYSPNDNEHQKYRVFYEKGYLPLQAPIRSYSDIIT